MDRRGADVVYLDRSDSNRLVLVNVGAVLDVRLPARASPPEVSGPVTVDSASATPTDATGRRWLFRAVAAGEATLTASIHTGSRTGVSRRWTVLLRILDGDEPAV